MKLKNRLLIKLGVNVKVVKVEKYDKVKVVKLLKGVVRDLKTS